MAEYAAKSGAAGVDLKAHRARGNAAWLEKTAWKPLYDECYQYAIPYRRPGKYGKGANRVDNLFDDTAITSTFHGAGALKEDLFPSGTAFFKLEPGPLSKLAGKMDPEKLKSFALELENISDQVAPFFQTGEFDQAATEMCIDLYAGTGVIIPIAGDDDNPVRFVTPPADEIAIEGGPFGDVAALFWKTEMPRRAIMTAWPKAKYPEDFTKALATDPEGKTELCQDYVREGKKWCLYVTVKECADSEPPIASETYRSQPFTCARYHRVPGEDYGRGPIMLTLPAIKTSNKAQELTLKAFAIQMLGIWAYRPGGAFNPDTARIAPGAFWPMNSTGGVMGPDVSRLDPATGRVDLANLVTGNLTERIRTGLHDERLDSGGKTPVSASEYIGNLQKMKQNYIGAFGRLVHEIVPTIVPRVIEILYRKHLLQTKVKIDQLFVQCRVTSPLAAQMRLEHLQPLTQWLQLIGLVQQNPSRFIKLDVALDEVGADLNVPARWRLSPAERAAVDDAAAKQAAASAVTTALVKKPEIVANAMQPQQPAQAP